MSPVSLGPGEHAATSCGHSTRQVLLMGRGSMRPQAVIRKIHELLTLLLFFSITDSDLCSHRIVVIRKCLLVAKEGVKNSKKPVWCRELEEEKKRAFGF